MIKEIDTYGYGEISMWEWVEYVIKSRDEKNVLKINTEAKQFEKNKIIDIMQEKESNRHKLVNIEKNNKSHYQSSINHNKFESG